MAPLKITIVGSGNWGSAIARIIGSNVTKHSQEFDATVRMWVFEEMIEGRKLTEIINQDHENVKYLPGKKLPPNVVAVPDVVDACVDSDILVFVIPHQFVPRLCTQIKDKLKPGVFAVSLIKGLAEAADGGAKLISRDIAEACNIDVNVLMGANLANEVAEDHFCESTVGAKNAQQGALLKKVFQTENFRITVVQDVETVEVCGALKNVVACGAGFSDGLCYGDNTKAAIIRLGLMEMIEFIKIFFNGSQLPTFFESCGVADLVTTCYGGRNRKCSEAFVKTGKSMEEVEKELLGGQKLQGPETAAQAYKMLQTRNMEDKFPLFVAVHKICTGQMKADKFVDCLRKHPAHY